MFENNVQGERWFHKSHPDHCRSVILRSPVKHCRSCRSNRLACHRECRESGMSNDQDGTQRVEAALSFLEACSMYSAKYRSPNKHRTNRHYHSGPVLRKCTVRRCSLLTHRWRSRKLGTIRVHRTQILGRNNRL